MPSPSRADPPADPATDSASDSAADAPLRLAVFGDSHYACVRAAEGRVDLAGLDVEYWGHVGRRFKFLTWADDAIRATDDQTALRFAKFNEKGRTNLPAREFDAILFVGCRLYLTPIFLLAAQARADGRHLSSALTDRLILDRLTGTPTWDFAVQAARLGTRILISPPSFPTEGGEHGWQELFPDGGALTPDDRAHVWDRAQALMAGFGVTLVPQPVETVAAGATTWLSFATDGHATTGDAEHKNADYGALVWRDALAALRGAV